MRFPPETVARFRRTLMTRGQSLATILSELLAGKDKRGALASLAMFAKPGMRPEEIVRAALDANEAIRKRIDADDDQYGRCEICGEDLGVAALGEMPWADRCVAHAAILTT